MHTIYCNTHNTVTSQVSHIQAAQSVPIGLESPHHYCLIPIDGSEGEVAAGWGDLTSHLRYVPGT